MTFHVQLSQIASAGSDAEVSSSGRVFSSTSLESERIMITIVICGRNREISDGSLIRFSSTRRMSLCGSHTREKEGYVQASDNSSENFAVYRSMKDVKLHINRNSLVKQVIHQIDEEIS